KSLRQTTRQFRANASRTSRWYSVHEHSALGNLSILRTEATMMLRRRRQCARPHIEKLESRVTPTNIGINLNANVSYLGDYIWVDVHNLFKDWGPPNNAGGSGVPVNANNYPLAPASTDADLSDYPDGDYQLSYQGAGTVSFSGIG